MIVRYQRMLWANTRFAPTGACPAGTPLAERLPTLPTIGAPRPVHRGVYIPITDAELLQLLPNLIRTVRAHGDEQDVPVLVANIEIIHVRIVRNHGLGQGQLVLRRLFCEQSRLANVITD